MNDDTEFAPFACHSDFHISKWVLHDSLEHCKITTYRNIGNESDSVLEGAGKVVVSQRVAS